LQAGYFSPGVKVLYGKYKNKKGIVKGFGSDKWGNPTIEIEPIPKGRKQNVIVGLFKIWRADVKEKALAELAAQPKLAGSKKPLYSAVVLDDSSHDKLLRWWKSEIGPLLSKHLAHHMTIKFKPSIGEVERLPLGKKVRLTVVGYGQDEEAQAVHVATSVRSSNAIPHITVATRPGGKAKHSNDLDFERVGGLGGKRIAQLALTGTVQAIMGNGSFYVAEDTDTVRPTQDQVDFATRLIQQVGGELPDFDKMDQGEMSSLIQGLKKKRGTPTWHANGQFRKWEPHDWLKRDQRK
jgi:hypothetical protein